MKIRIPFLLLLFFCGLILKGQDVALPSLSKRVTDLTGTLSQSEQRILEDKLKNFESEKGSQVVVVVIPTTGDESIEQYSIRLAEKWKIGRGGVDDGVVMLFSMNDRKMRIEVGYALEGALTDALSKRIIENVIVPDFRSGHFYNGIDRGVGVVLTAISGEELPPVVRQKSSTSTGGKSPWRALLFPLMVVLFIVSGLLKSVLGKKYGKGKVIAVSAVIVFILGWVFFGLLVSVFITAILTIFTSMPSGGRGGGGIYMGGGGFSSGGGGGFGGGFSGGGGGFGGGGASGGW